MTVDDSSLHADQNTRLEQDLTIAAYFLAYLESWKKINIMLLNKQIKHYLNRVTLSQDKMG